jgi:hypothetical protein
MISAFENVSEIDLFGSSARAAAGNAVCDDDCDDDCAQTVSALNNERIRPRLRIDRAGILSPFAKDLANFVLFNLIINQIGLLIRAIFCGALTFYYHFLLLSSAWFSVKIALGIIQLLIIGSPQRRKYD